MNCRWSNPRSETFASGDNGMQAAAVAVGCVLAALFVGGLSELPRSSLRYRRLPSCAGTAICHNETTSQPGPPRPRTRSTTNPWDYLPYNTGAMASPGSGESPYSDDCKRRIPANQRSMSVALRTTYSATSG